MNETVRLDKNAEAIFGIALIVTEKRIPKSWDHDLTDNGRGDGR